MEVLNDLLDYQGLKIYQDTEMFSFSLDSVLLANFVTLNKNIKEVLDIGSGNAVIPMILSTKTKANITGIEIQEKSFNLGDKSIKYNKLEDKITFILSDVNTGKTIAELIYNKNVSRHAEVDLSCNVDENTLVFRYLEFINPEKK